MPKRYFTTNDPNNPYFKCAQCADSYPYMVELYYPERTYICRQCYEHKNPLQTKISNTMFFDITIQEAVKYIQEVNIWHGESYLLEDLKYLVGLSQGTIEALYVYYRKRYPALNLKGRDFLIEVIIYLHVKELFRMRKHPKINAYFI